MPEKNRKTVFVLHTSFALVDPLGRLFKEHLPEVRIVNIVDDSLLADVRAAGHLIPSVTRRMAGYATLAQSAGADALFNACSSVGEAADVIRNLVDIPVVKVDDRMAEEAAIRGPRVAVVATVQTTLDPTIRLIERKARELGTTVRMNRHLVEGAFDALMAGNAEQHDLLVSAEIERAAHDADVVALAQASMARLVPRLEGKTAVMLLSSPALGVLQLKQVLAQMDNVVAAAR